MKKYPAILLFLAALLSVPLPGQFTAPAPGQPAAVAAKVMSDALTLRRAMAESVGQAIETPKDALIRLQAAPTPSGLIIDHDADYAIAAIDVGQRLIVARKLLEAEPFFYEAEKSLGKAIQRTPDTAAREKAWFLAQRALVRANFLNKTPEADSDLGAAITLQPDDQYLQRKRDQLPAGKTGIVNMQPKGK